VLSELWTKSSKLWCAVETGSLKISGWIRNVFIRATALYCRHTLVLMIQWGEQALLKHPRCIMHVMRVLSCWGKYLVVRWREWSQQVFFCVVKERRSIIFVWPIQSLCRNRWACIPTLWMVCRSRRLFIYVVCTEVKDKSRPWWLLSAATAHCGYAALRFTHIGESYLICLPFGQNKRKCVVWHPNFVRGERIASIRPHELYPV